MPAHRNQLAIPSRAPEATAAFLGELLALSVGRDDALPCLRLAGGARLLFPSTLETGPQHVAFQVSKDEFEVVIESLRRAGLPFGNDADARTNGEIEDPLGGDGRVYFHDRDGNLFEVCA